MAASAASAAKCGATEITSTSIILTHKLYPLVNKLVDPHNLA